MGNFLHTLGVSAFKHKWRVLFLWLAGLIVLGGLAFAFMTPTSTAVNIPGTEAQKALDRFAELFPESGKGTGRIVFESPAGKTLQDFQQPIETVVTEASKMDAVSTAISPFVNVNALSEDKTIGYVQLQLKNEGGAVSEEITSAIDTIVANARKSGMTVESGGDIINKAPGEILGVGEIAGVLIALLVLFLTLGSLVSAGMPIVVALITIGVSMTGLFALSQVIDISSTTPVLAVMLGLAVGIDYSLFIISKYRSYLLEGHKNKDAVGRAIATAGNAVIFAAATVVIALSSLAIVNIPFMTTMGLAGAATVALAAIVAVTLVPALLGFAGNKIFRGKTKKAIKLAREKGPRKNHVVSHKTIWYKWGAILTRRPVIFLVISIAAIVTVALPARDLTLGLPTDEYAASSTTQRKAYDLLTKGFGAGFNGPLLVVVENLPAVTDTEKATVRDNVMGQYQAKVADETAKQTATFAAQAAAITTPEEYAQLQQDIATSSSEGAAKQAAALAQVEAQIAQYSKLYQLNLIAEKITENSGVKQALPALITDDTRSGVIQVTPSTAPSDVKTIELINFLRDDASQAYLSGNDKVTFEVTGSTALQADINHKLADALPLYLSVVIGLSLILLIVAFRSILIPIKATLGFLLSVLAMFGVMVAVFQWGWFGISDAPGPIVSFIPIIAIGILFGLAMDYEFFIVSSMHEAYGRTKDAKKAVIDGFGLGSKVVLSAGIIMVSVFAGFIFNHDATIQSIGLGLAVGIFIDAFIVRMTIVPAAMTLLGKSAWWIPRWLDRALPHISIEGEEADVSSTVKKKS